MIMVLMSKIVPVIAPGLAESSFFPYPPGIIASFGSLLVVGVVLNIAFLIRHHPSWPWRSRIIATCFCIFSSLTAYFFGFAWWLLMLFGIFVGLQNRGIQINFCKSLLLLKNSRNGHLMIEYEQALKDFEEDRRKYGRFYVAYLAKVIINRARS